ncbi:hypothetical protein EIP91_012431 [Steccherinum ochraceum]|uniref:DUF1793-domain-containing protein n=1 Tax=Steccherinum ochraceum TaxID=92696 RepID=A0A4R0RIV5_9APHY|nr:hypothetical protein EIP91_012431 [Steccherinum ochraceum]
MARVLLFTFLILTFFASCIISQNPPVNLPLAIRSPYFNCWGDATAPGQNWPFLWNSNHLGLYGSIRVDGIAYKWVGGDSPGLNLTSRVDLQITPTRTMYTLQAGPSMLINVTFMTPIETEDLVTQSIPFSYIYLDAMSTDGQPHDVQVYLDITGEWVTGNRSEIITWKGTKSATSTFYETWLSTQTQYEEKNDQIEDATAYIAMRSGPTVTATVAGLFDNRGGFSDKGVLPDPDTDTSRAVSDNWPVFAVAADLGRISQTSQSVVWAVGVARNPVIAYTTGTGAVQNRAPYFMVQYPNIESAIDAFLLDSDDARQRSIALDAKIAGDTAAISPVYTGLVSLAARQVIGSTDLTIANGTDGKWNMSDVKMFMKDVGSSGRINPVETLYASLPYFLYVNASYIGYLLEPLLEFQNSSQYTQPYAATDLGTSYPKAVGSNQPHAQGIEQTGNMLIMALAHAQSSGDGSLISRYYDLLSSWAKYLVNTVPNASQQVTADLESMTNMSNLLIKGIIAIQAMSTIAGSLDRGDDASTFSNSAQSLLNTWVTSGVSPDGSHVLATYGDQNSWALPYNLFADKLLQTNLVNITFYTSEAAFLKTFLASSSSPETPFGIPIDSSVTSQADAGWSVFTAAITPDTAVRDTLIQPVYSAIASNQSTLTYSKIYKLDSGESVSGRSSPALGAILAPLALNLSIKTISVPPPPPLPPKRSIAGPVVGGVLGGLGLLALGFAGFFYWRYRQRRKYRFSGKLDIDEAGSPGHATIYGLPPGSDPGAFPVSPESPDDRGSRELLMASNTPMVVSVVRPSKHQEAAQQRERYMLPPGSAPSPPTSSNSGHSTDPGSSVEPPTTVSPTSGSEVQGLRVEVENLRKAMQQIQVAPPEYSQ